jgi:hypothetical protein
MSDMMPGGSQFAAALKMQIGVVNQINASQFAIFILHFRLKTEN